MLKQAAKVYAHFGCLPVPSRAILRRHDVEEQLSIQTRWTQTDPLRRDKIVMEQDHLICHASSTKLLFSAPPQPISLGACFPYADNSARQLWDIECGAKSSEGDDEDVGLCRLLIVEYKLPPRALADSEALKATAPTQGTFAQIITANGGRRVKTIKLPTLGEKALHGRVYPCGAPSTPFSACRSSFNGHKIVYLAEALPPKNEVVYFLAIFRVSFALAISPRSLSLKSIHQKVVLATNIRLRALVQPLLSIYANSIDVKGNFTFKNSLRLLFKWSRPCF